MASIERFKIKRYYHISNKKVKAKIKGKLIL